MSLEEHLALFLSAINFSIALALDNNLVTPKTVIKDIPSSIKCSKHKISDIKEFPKDLTVEDILIRSSNIGTLLLARKIGEEKFKKFINDNIPSEICGHKILSISKIDGLNSGNFAIFKAPETIFTFLPSGEIFELVFFCFDLLDLV